MLNIFTLNTAVLNGDARIESGGTLITIEQDVELRLVGDGVLISVEQEVITVSSGTLINIEQMVVSPTANTFYTKNDWDVAVLLGGEQLNRGTIFGDLVITKYEDESHSAAFTIIPGNGTYNLFNYQGKRVKIVIRTASGWYTAFTGKVDIPKVDLINERITLNCIADRKTLIKQNLQNSVQDIGHYSAAVLGNINDLYQEVNARLETTPYSLDFDGSNNWQLASWTPASSPNFTYGSGDVYYAEPQVIIESGKDVINKITINFSYLYQRLHQRQITYSYVYGGSIYNVGELSGPEDICTKLLYETSVPTQEMIRAAAMAAGWRVSDMTFDELWPGGWYSCGGHLIGWSPIHFDFNTQPQTDLSGNPVVDEQGNAVRSATITSSTNGNDYLCIGANWRARKRFAQNIEEKYTMTVQSTQSREIYGTTEETQSYTLTSPYDSDFWEDEKNYDLTPDGTIIESGTSAQTFYVNKDLTLRDLNKGIRAALWKAKTRILAQHRDSRIVFDRFITPEIELYHTIELTGKWVQGKGKVRSVTHTLNVDGEARTHVELALYRSLGSSDNDPLVPPSRPIDSAPTAPSGISIGSRWGYDPNSTGSERWVGYVGNAFIGTQVFGSYAGTNHTLTKYQESFIVDTPAVPDIYRNNRVLAKTATYNISIPNITLNTVFYWDNLHV